MKKVLIIFAMMLTLENAIGQLPGNYMSAEYNLFQLGLLYLEGVDTYITGMNLNLEPDSSFHLTTCSTVETGKWSILHDSLCLEVITRKFRIDSLNYSEKYADWFKEPFRTIKYDIIENGFYREIYLKDDNNEKKNAADKLIKKPCANE